MTMKYLSFFVIYIDNTAIGSGAALSNITVSVLVYSNIRFKKASEFNQSTSIPLLDTNAGYNYVIPSLASNTFGENKRFQ